MEPSRNQALEFARRTRKNLKHVEKALEEGKDVHVITQLAKSMLGFVVFSRERDTVEKVGELRLDRLAAEGWPRFQITKGKCETLGALVRYLRNAMAHGHIRFSSDSRNLSEVTIHVENYAHRASAPNWCADLGARDLREFCLKFVDLLEKELG